MPSILDAWSATADSDPTGSPTISAGNNRCFILALHIEFNGIVTVSTMTVGGVAPTVSIEDFWDNGVEDLMRYIYIWDEDAIASMSGTSISYTDDKTLSKRGFATATYQDVNQVSLPTFNTTAEQVDVNTTLDITTTSTANDIVLVFGTEAGQRSFTDWDTLTEAYDLVLNTSQARMGAAAGAGGDGTTTVTISAIADLALTSVVLGAGGIVPQAMYHYRNHGKI